ncbi:MAG TPA: secretin and TonB N-terminal domain-containing protein, partial [Puia sp.]|nr:secretin and TonB N-terminal domain-containing protein [Puia sp.]
MKIERFSVLLAALCLCISAGAFSQTVTLSVNDQPLHVVLKSIKRQTKYTFFADAEVMKKERNITVQLKNVSLQEALDACFKNQPLIYSIEGRVITIQPKSDQAAPPPSGGAGVLPPITVTGRVVDQDGKPLSGATFLVRGGGRSGVAGADGSFSLQANAGDVLVFTFVGYE